MVNLALFSGSSHKKIQLKGHNSFQLNHSDELFDQLNMNINMLYLFFVGYKKFSYMIYNITPIAHTSQFWLYVLLSIISGAANIDYILYSTLHLQFSLLCYTLISFQIKECIDDKLLRNNSLFKYLKIRVV